VQRRRHPHKFDQIPTDVTGAEISRFDHSFSKLGHVAPSAVHPASTETGATPTLLSST
jgi:hypothetical protein